MGRLVEGRRHRSCRRSSGRSGEPISQPRPRFAGLCLRRSDCDCGNAGLRRKPEPMWSACSPFLAQILNGRCVLSQGRWTP